MIHTAWPYLAVMLLAAGAFPALERRYKWRFFEVLPPIVLTYLLVTALAVTGLWQVNDEIRATQNMLIEHMVPALLFLLMINCDLRAIFRLGPRVLAVFFATTVCLFVAFIATFLMFRYWLSGNAWQPLAALSGSWIGGTANMVAVKQAIGMPDRLLAMSLLTDALCYSMWVVVLFGLGRLAPAFNRWTKARSSAEMVVEETRSHGPTTPENVLLWLGMALLAAAVSSWLADHLPTSEMVSPTTWTIMLATGFGLVAAHTPLARFAGAQTISSAMLISVVAVLASQSNFDGIGAAPLYLMCGVTIIAIHAALLALLARVFHFDL